MKFTVLIRFSLFLCSFSSVFSQSNQNIFFNREKYLFLEGNISSADLKFHSSIKPFSNSREIEVLNDSISKISSKEKKSLNRISADGIFASELNYENGSASASNILLDGGLRIGGYFKDKFSFNTIFLSGYSSFPSYLDSFISKSGVIPGIGTAYGSDGKYSYQYSSGYVSYSPNKVFNFQVGKDKHFFGDGYRSLFLSDLSNSFPFAKISTTIWKIKYVSLFVMMKDVTAPYHLQKDFKNKFGTFHYLSWNVSRRFNFSFFESVIWQGKDTNRVRNFDVNYLNPVVFYRPTEYSLGSSDNSLLGAGFKIKLGRKYRSQLYGQVILDEFLLKEVKAMRGWWGNKQGVQLGFKSFDLFAVKNLSFQTEVNAVRPYTYSHGSVQQNYANYNQPLAHPLGSNFAESVSFLNYRYKKWTFQTEFLFAFYGKDSTGGRNMGNNIFVSYNSHALPSGYGEFGNYLGQGIKTHLRYVQFKISYCLIPSADLLAEAGFATRQETNSVSSLNTNFFFIGIKTAILNRYSDF